MHHGGVVEDTVVDAVVLPTSVVVELVALRVMLWLDVVLLELVEV